MSYDQIPGFSGFLWAYEEAVKEKEDGAVFVEVGVALGHSVAYLARLLIDAGKNVSEVWAVDPWGGYARNGEQQALLGAKKDGDFTLYCKQMLMFARDEFERVKVIRARSERASRLFRAESVDMVMIDGAHDYQSVLEDIETWAPKLRAGGWLAGDDHEPTYPGVEQAVTAHFGPGVAEVIGTTWRVKM